MNPSLHSTPSSRARLDAAAIEARALRLVPEQIARSRCLVPVRLQEDRLVVAMRDPDDQEALESVRFACGLQVHPLPAAEEEIEAAIQERYGARLAACEDEGGSVVALLDAILRQAVAARASDIHVECREKQVLVRVRVDGMLAPVKEVPKALQGALISRIKIMADLDISEKRLPQDGKAQVKARDRSVNLRVSTLPSQYGEKIVIRILDDRQQALASGNLGLMPENMRRVQEMIRQTQGIVLVCGPTGSGKSTTLYSLLAELARKQINVVTVEDPVEYTLEGITQVQVNERTGLTFVKSLRSILRQDPNVILVGEIRDRETAETAMQAAMTGHLVLSTLHTNGAVASIARLQDLKVDGFVLANALNGVLAQRLVRRICESCRRPYQPPPELLARVAGRLARGAPFVFYQGAGCERCQGTGYSGRIAVHELLAISDELRRLIGEGAPEPELLKAARRSGLRSLLDDALEKVQLGVTTLEEADRVLFLREEGPEPPADAALPREAARPPRAAPARPGLEGMKLLLVDDHAEVFGGLARALQREGFSVSLARDGREALERMTADRPDLVVSDVRMPVMDGIEMVERMRRGGPAAFVPVILLSEKVDVEDRLRGFESGVDDYVSKPFSIAEMLHRIKAVLKRAYF